MAVRYRGVSSSENVVEDDEVKKTRTDNMDRAMAKIHALIWVICAGALVYWTDFFNVLVQSELINRSCLGLAGITFVGSMFIMLYLTLWLPLIKKVTIPWEVYCPRMIPASTALGVSTYILLMISFWPVWGLLTPIIVTVLLIGFLFTSHFIPWPC